MEDLISSGIITPDGQIVVLQGWIGAAIAGISALVSALIASESSKKQAKKTAQANMDLAQYQADTNEKLIDKQNQYNAPIAQMTRFGDAGLNPNLIYGQGNAGNQASPARYEAPTVDYHFQPFQIPDLIGQYQDVSMKQAQIDNIDAQTSNIRERTVNEAIRSGLLSEQTSATRASVGKTMQDMLKGKVDIDRAKFELGKGKALFPYQADILQSQMQRQRTAVNTDLLKWRILRDTESDITDQQRLKTTFMKYESAFRKQGINNSDHVLVRMLSKMLMRAGIE